MKKMLVIAVALLVTGQLYAQKKGDKKDSRVVLEEVKQQCAALPMAKRATVTVTPFTMGGPAAKTNAPAAKNDPYSRQLEMMKQMQQMAEQAKASEGMPPNLAADLTTDLSSALQGVNCFRVLQALAVTDNTEIDSATSGQYANRQAGIKKGQQLSAQLLVQGQITEYGKETKTKENFVNSKTTTTVKLGFNLELYNPATREIIASNTFRVEASAKSTTSSLGFGGSSEADPNITAVMDDAIVQAVQYIARMRDSLNITADYFNGAMAEDPNATNQTDITLNNATISTFSSFATLLSGLSMYKNLTKKFGAGVATYSVTHAGSTDKLFDELNQKIGSAYEVTGYGDGKIEVKVK